MTKNKKIKNQAPEKGSFSSWWLRLSLIYILIILSAFYISKQNGGDITNKPLQSFICKLSAVCRVYGETLQYVNQTILLPNAPLPQEQYSKEICICPSIKEE